jgi:hypothetical protein
VGDKKITHEGGTLKLGGGSLRKEKINNKKKFIVVLFV